MGFGGGMPSAEEMAKMAEQMKGAGGGLPPAPGSDRRRLNPARAASILSETGR